jgi:hypothetical protein
MSEKMSLAVKIELVRKFFLEWPELRGRPFENGKYLPLMRESHGFILVLGEEVVSEIPRLAEWANEAIDTAAIQDFIYNRSPSSLHSAVQALTTAHGIALRMGSDDSKQNVERGATLDDIALGFFFADPTRDITAIAKLMKKKHTQSLAPDRCPKLHAAMKAYHEGCSTARPRGTKDDDGNMEAWDDEEEDT